MDDPIAADHLTDPEQAEYTRILFRFMNHF